MTTHEPPIMAGPGYGEPSPTTSSVPPAASSESPEQRIARLETQIAQLTTGIERIPNALQQMLADGSLQPPQVQVPTQQPTQQPAAGDPGGLVGAVQSAMAGGSVDGLMGFVNLLKSVGLIKTPAPPAQVDPLDTFFEQYQRMMSIHGMVQESVMNQFKAATTMKNALNSEERLSLRAAEHILGMKKKSDSVLNPVAVVQPVVEAVAAMAPTPITRARTKPKPKPAVTRVPKPNLQPVPKGQ